ncbi:MAG: hypothetical protein CFE44_14070 [Burkholderiales bacterium PBB4]|nr:MAG: hypothetical protein CFE44_14070 [Burkholderiales bacterium PBB4]
MTISPVTTTAFSTHFSKKNQLERILHALLIALVLGFVSVVYAQTATELSQVRVERVEDELLVSAQVAFELPGAVEEAMLKGIPMYFVAHAEVTKERWYWYDKRVISAERHMRVAYQPLTRRWRLNITAAADKSGPTGLALNQSFDTLQQALTVVKRIFRWKIADAADVEANGRYKMDLKFRLDLSQLPRPFQIGAIGQSEWDVAAAFNAPLVVETPK